MLNAENVILNCVHAMQQAIFFLFSLLLEDGMFKMYRKENRVLQLKL